MQHDVPAMMATVRSGGSPDAARDPTPPACASIMPAATATDRDSPRSRAADVVAPDPKLRTFHDAKYDVFRRLGDAQADFKRQMADA